MDWFNRCHFGDCLETMRRMPDGIAQTCVTSPPYFGLRDYGHAGQIGLEETPAAFVAKLVEVFREVRRLLKDDGTLWLNLGDSYAGSWGAQGRSGGNTDGKHSYNKSISAGQIEAHPRKTHHTGSIALGSGLKPKDLMGIPWRVAFALQEDGWYLRQDIIWHKPNPMPESVLDRCTKAHEYIFLFSKAPSYYCDMGAIAERASGIAEAPRNRWDRADYEIPGQKPQKRAARSGNTERKPRPGLAGDSRHQQGSVPWEGATRNKRSVWTVATTPYKGAHFATFPTELIEPCILAGAPAGGVVLDQFFGSGTTGQVAQQLGRQFIGIELNETYEPLQRERLRQPSLLLEAA
jgi:DNA modification methylase